MRPFSEDSGDPITITIYLKSKRYGSIRSSIKPPPWDRAPDFYRHRACMLCFVIASEVVQ
ncbi:MAG: hypothetical protein WBM02_04500 [bacterium]